VSSVRLAFDTIARQGPALRFPRRSAREGPECLRGTRFRRAGAMHRTGYGGIFSTAKN
jgi:hypothetical protein